MLRRYCYCSQTRHNTSITTQYPPFHTTIYQSSASPWKIIFYTLLVIILVSLIIYLIYNFVIVKDCIIKTQNQFMQAQHEIQEAINCFDQIQQDDILIQHIQTLNAEVANLQVQAQTLIELKPLNQFIAHQNKILTMLQKNQDLSTIQQSFSLTNHDLVPLLIGLYSYSVIKNNRQPIKNFNNFNPIITQLLQYHYKIEQQIYTDLINRINKYKNQRDQTHQLTIIRILSTWQLVDNPTLSDINGIFLLFRLALILLPYTNLTLLYNQLYKFKNQSKNLIIRYNLFHCCILIKARKKFIQHYHQHKSKHNNSKIIQNYYQYYFESEYNTAKSILQDQQFITINKSDVLIGENKPYKTYMQHVFDQAYQYINTPFNIKRLNKKKSIFFWMN